jgi:hypothetical protein
VTLALVAACLPALPFAANSHAVNLTLKAAGIDDIAGPDPQGPPILSIETGVFKGSLGTGVTRIDVRVRDGKGTQEFYNRHGSFHGGFLFGGVHKSDGDTIVGTLTITGGTGRYAHAHGKLHIDGFHNDKTGYANQHITGSLTY